VAFEAVYVKKYHRGGSLVVRHSLSFLQTVPLSQRASNHSYASWGADTQDYLEEAANTLVRGATPFNPPLESEAGAPRVGSGLMASETGTRKHRLPSTAPLFPPLSVNPLKVQTAAVAFAGVLGLVKLVCDAYMLEALRGMIEFYEEQSPSRWPYFQLPESAVSAGPEAVTNWHIAYERKEVLWRWWFGFNDANLAFSILGLLYVLS
jgi:hypothetical protein